MPQKKFLDEVGLAEVATHVNNRLKTVTTMPLTADVGALRLYVGEDTNDFKKGHIYQFSDLGVYHGFGWTELENDPPFTYHIYLKNIEVGATIYSTADAQLATSVNDLGTTLDSQMRVTDILPNGNIEVTSETVVVTFTREPTWDLGNSGWVDISSSIDEEARELAAGAMALAEQAMASAPESISSETISELFN